MQTLSSRGRTAVPTDRFHEGPALMRTLTLPQARAWLARGDLVLAAHGRLEWLYDTHPDLCVVSSNVSRDWPEICREALDWLPVGERGSCWRRDGRNELVASRDHRRDCTTAAAPRGEGRMAGASTANPIAHAAETSAPVCECPSPPMGRKGSSRATNPCLAQREATRPVAPPATTLRHDRSSCLDVTAHGRAVTSRTHRLRTPRSAPP